MTTPDGIFFFDYLQCHALGGAQIESTNVDDLELLTSNIEFEAQAQTEITDLGMWFVSANISNMK